VSFILDALRKSEHERQRQAGPAIAELPVVRPPSRMPVILVAIGALLAVNLVVVLYWLLNDRAPEVVREEAVAAQPAPAPTTPVPVTTTPAQEAPRPAPVRPREVRPLADEVVAGPPMDAAPPPPPDPALLPTTPYPTSTPFAEQRQQTEGGDSIPRIDTLPAQATAGLPVLNLDLHIYATDPAQRAAFINGRRYVAGDRLPEGVDVVAISQEGVVLRYGGRQFLLPRR